VTGPLDVIGDSGAGAMRENLADAVEAAMTIDPGFCRAHALKFSWADATAQFLDHVTRANNHIVAAKMELSR